MRPVHFFYAYFCLNPTTIQRHTTLLHSFESSTSPTLRLTTSSDSCERHSPRHFRISKLFSIFTLDVKATHNVCMPGPVIPRIGERHNTTGESCRQPRGAPGPGSRPRRRCVGRSRASRTDTGPPAEKVLFLEEGYPSGSTTRHGLMGI